ncbi:MAG: F0F1 ATP synthase subunit B, partial [Chloroflexota bacterium]|nr:F0F1 ATP synthase subunit B [Chloroflexota bacterium]
AQIINFGILLVLLYMFAYKPLLKTLDERSKRVEESIEQADALKKQSASAEEEIRKQLLQAAKEAQERLARVDKAGEEMKQKAREDAKKDAEVLISRARSEIQHERDQAVGELRKEFADLTIMAAEKVIDRSLDAEAHRALVEKVLEESSSLKKE